MIVNRDNYEAYFISYIDAELSPLEKAEVELFAEENADLAKELEMLKLTILPVQKIAFDEKEFLYKKTNAVSLENYEVYFLLYADQELKPDEKREVEHFILTHPELQDEFVLLKQAKLLPENLPFAEKEKLYRNAENGIPWFVVPLRRITMVAAIIAVVALTWNAVDNFTVSNSTNQNPVVAISPGKQVETDVMKERQSAFSRGVGKKPVVKLENSKGREKTAIVKIHVQHPKEKKRHIMTGEFEENVPVALTRKKKLVPEGAGELIQGKKTTGSGFQRKQDEKVAGFNNSESRAATASLTSDAVYKYNEIDIQSDDIDVIYLGAAKINKNKFKDLIHKAAGFFGKNNNNKDDESKLRIASFEFNKK